MSLILDALKKSEAERRRGQPPSLHAQFGAPRRTRRTPWVAGAGAVLLQAAGAITLHNAVDAGSGALSVRAGGSHDGFELPVEEALAKRLDTIALVRAASDLLPEDAFWVPAMIGTTQQGRPRLVLDRSPRPSKRSALVALSATMMSQGRHGWSGDARKAEVRNGDGASAVLKTMHVTSRGGGLASSLSVAVLVEGEPPLPTGSGSGLVFAEAGGYRREAILTDPQ